MLKLEDYRLANGLRVSFINGEPCSFQSRGREEFPSFLTARGKIGLTDLRQFVESGETRLFLTQVGLLTYDELGEESRLFLSKKLAEALAAFSAGRLRPVSSAGTSASRGGARGENRENCGAESG